MSPIFFTIMSKIKITFPDGNQKEFDQDITGRQIAEYLLIAFLASAVCAAMIAWGLELFQVVPFIVVGPLITLNNFVMAAIIGPFLVRLLHPRARRWNILWTEIMEPDEISRSSRPWIGTSLMWVGGLGALAVGLAVSKGLYSSALGFGVVVAMLPFFILFLIGCLLA